MRPCVRPDVGPCVGRTIIVAAAALPAILIGARTTLPLPRAEPSCLLRMLTVNVFALGQALPTDGGAGTLGKHCQWTGAQERWASTANGWGRRNAGQALPTDGGVEGGTRDILTGAAGRRNRGGRGGGEARSPYGASFRHRSGVSVYRCVHTDAQTMQRQCGPPEQS